MIRPSWDEYFMDFAEVVKNRSTCQAPKGAVLVRDNHTLTTGYNETPAGIKNCGDGGCRRCQDRRAGLIKSGEALEACLCNHCEENTILQAALLGISTKGSTMYTTYTPCTMCAKMLINAGIKRVVAKEPYPDDLGVVLMKEVGITLDLFRKV